ncbi:hypothetical protein V8E55_012000 [Tylopilus felleus]
MKSGSASSATPPTSPVPLSQTHLRPYQPHRPHTREPAPLASEKLSSPPVLSSASANNGDTSPLSISINPCKGILVSTRLLGEYIQRRLDITIRDYSENPQAESDLLATLITCMPHLAVFSFSVTSSFTVPDVLNPVLDALQHSAASLHVLDWSFGLVQGTPTRRYLPHFDPSAARRPEPTVHQELIQDINRNLQYWEDLLYVYSDQLVSVQVLTDVESNLQLLA